jgi:hypothetical protein
MILMISIAVTAAHMNVAYVSDGWAAGSGHMQTGREVFAGD